MSVQGGTYLDNCPACPFGKAWCHGLLQPELCPELSATAEAQAPAEGPGLVRKAINLGQAVAEHVAAGRPLVDDETAAGRLAICHRCPQLDGDTCRLCGCRMSVKATWAEQRCPIGKWEAVATP
jgi:hypothetical protein